MLMLSAPGLECLVLVVYQLPGGTWENLGEAVRTCDLSRSFLRKIVCGISLVSIVQGVQTVTRTLAPVVQKAKHSHELLASY